MENILTSWLVSQKIAHRGLHNSKSAPENSRQAFENAILNNFAIELDVHIISDGTLVVIHDDTLDRTTNSKGEVKSLTKRDLANIKLKGTNESLPTFDEVLKLVKGKVPLLIEVKNEGKVGELEEKLYETLKKYKGKYAIQSFNPFVLKWFRINAPEVWRGQLSGSFKGEKLSYVKKVILKRMLLNDRVSKPDFISYDHRALPNKYVLKYGELPLLAYTIRSNQNMKNAKLNGVDNFIFEDFIPKEPFNKIVEGND